MTRFGKIYLRLIANREPPDRAEIFKIVQQQLKLPLTGLRQVRNGYNAFTEREEDVEKLLSSEAKKKLIALGLEVKLPPKIRAARAIICRQIDSYVGEHTKEQIEVEINRCNEHLRVVEVVKFGAHSHVFKVEFETIEMANRTLENGILLFHCKISPSQIKKEEYIDVLMCFKCYKLEEHATKDCPRPLLVICSECAGDHDYRDCKSLTKKCINCKGPHRTMAMSCPAKKTAIADKKAREEHEKKTNQEKTYAGIVNSTIRNVDQTNTTNALGDAMRTTGIRAFIMIIDAHVNNIIEPGTYSSHLNETLLKNGIEPVKLRDNPASHKLFENKDISATLEALRKMRTESKKSSDSSSSSSSESDEEEEGHPTGEEETDKDEIVEHHMRRSALTSISSDLCSVEIDIATGTMEPQDIPAVEVTQLFKDHRLKYKILDKSKYTAENIEYMIEKEQLRVSKSSIVMVTKAAFRKIRNGPQGSPPK